jgi:hypothetical protein
MKYFATLCLTVAFLLAPSLAVAQSAHFSTGYTYPLQRATYLDSVLYNLGGGIRACGYDRDVDNDGKSEIVVTNYGDLGHVHVFEVVGNDSIKLVWSSPKVTTGGGGSTPRAALFGDLDNDGLKEVIYQVSGVGILIFEWDGVTGSDNYGTTPSQILGTGFLTGAGGSCEYFEVRDVDGDGSKELLAAYNGSTNADDNYYVVNAAGDWTTNDPGFSSFNVEYVGKRTELAAWGVGGGSPYAMITANFDGTGNPEILIHNWNRKNVVPIRVPAADTYQISDTTGGGQNLFLSGTDDNVSLFGGMACDVDKDGRDEVYLPTWYGANTASLYAGVVDMVFYEPGSNTAKIDSTNAVSFDLKSVIGSPDPTSVYNANILGFGYGDIDGNGKKNLYFSGIYLGSTGFNIVSMEFQGGDKRNPANWNASILLLGDPTTYTALTIQDSLGTVDTTARDVWPAQVAHMFAQGTDIDGDGREDLLMPYQGWYGAPDSIAITSLTWNSGAGKFDSSSYKVANNHRQTFRVLESDLVNGIEDKDWVVIMPDDYRLEQNYPNPFNPSTTIGFFLPVKDRVSVKIYDMLGKEIRTLIDNSEYPAGSSRVTWDGKNNSGQPASSGTYFYSLIHGNFKQTQKMMLLR